MKFYNNKYQHEPHGIGGVLRWKLGLKKSDQHDKGSTEVPASEPNSKGDFSHLGDSDIQLTWIGHSSFLLQLGSSNILIDPVYANYCSPVPLPGLKRAQPPGIKWSDLPEIHYVLISHNHYDHLDAKVVKKLAKTSVFLVPEGLSKWMKKRGVVKVEEIGWLESKIVNDLSITACPAQHSSARTPWDKDKSHWCGWLIEFLGKKIYYAGDTGYCPHFKDLGESYGPMDLSILPIGAYSPSWLMKPIHSSPEEAVQMHIDLNSKLSLGCHWGTFKLTDEPIMEPVKRVLDESKNKGLKAETFIVLPIGGKLSI